jgi:tellurium resistance protein TerD
MGYNLKKGESYSLAKTMSKCYIGLGWDINQTGSGYPFDLDVVALLLNDHGWLLPAPYGVVFYNNPTFPSLAENEWKQRGKRNEELIQKQAIWISGDDRTGDDGGDDEFIHIDFTKISQNVQQIIVAVCIYDAGIRKQTFGSINSYVRIAQDANYPDMARYDIDDNFKSETSLILGRLYLQNGTWQFEAMGKGTNDDLESLINSYA